MRYRILCAYDLRAPADGAFAFAVLLSDKLGGELHVLWVSEPDEAQPSSAWGGVTSAAGRAFAAPLDQLRERAAAHGVLANIELSVGAPAERIVMVDRQLGVGHIVLGAPQRAWADSVAQRVAAQALCAVTVVREPIRGRPRARRTDEA